MSIKNNITLFTFGLLTGITTYKIYNNVKKTEDIVETLFINDCDDNSYSENNIIQEKNVNNVNNVINDYTFIDMISEIKTITENDFSNNIQYLWNPLGKNMIISIIEYMRIQYLNGRMNNVLEDYIAINNIEPTEKEIKNILYSILFKYITFFQLINLAYDGDVDSIGLNKHNIPKNILEPVKIYLLSLPDFNEQKPNFSDINTCISEHNIFEIQLINIIETSFLNF